MTAECVTVHANWFSMPIRALGISSVAIVLAQMIFAKRKKKFVLLL